MSRKTLLLSFVLLLMLGLLAVSVVGAQDDLVFPIGEGDFSWGDLERFEAMDLSGEEIRISGPWVSADGELIESVLAYFEAATGADVVHSGSDSFEQQIVVDLQAGSPPNMAIFPQPGLAANLASQGLLVPLGQELADWTAENYAAGQSFVDLGTYADENGESQFFAFPWKSDLKSIVWYVPDNFEEAGYEVPETMEDLIALSDQIVADGGTPWCIGIGSEAATGWPATDWVEDMMLRTQPPEVYDQWVAHEIPFNDPAVVNAIETFGMFAKNDDYVAGGGQAVASTDFRDSPAGLFTVPPECYLHRQASFISSFFPEGTELGVDADFFYLPPFAEQDLGSPVLGGGTLIAITEDSEATRALLDFMTTGLSNEIWMAQTGFLTPNTNANTDVYTNDIIRQQNDILLNATTFRFDASDLMPSAIGAGAFWSAMVDYVSTDATAEEVATAVEEAWNALE